MARVVTKEELEVRRSQQAQADTKGMVDALVQAIRSIQFPAPNVVVSPAEPRVPVINVDAPSAPVIEVQMPEPVRQWRFDVVRDSDGLIKTIKATAA